MNLIVFDTVKFDLHSLRIELCALSVFASTGVRLLKSVYGCLFHKEISKSFTLSTHLAWSYQLCQHILNVPPQTALHSPRWLHSQVYSVFTAFCQHLKRTSQLCILINAVSTQKKSLHSPVSLVIYVSLFNRGWIEPFLFVLSVWPSSPILPSLSHLCPALHFAVFTCDVSHQTLLHPPLCSFLQCQSTIIPAVFFPLDAQRVDSSLCNFVWRKHFTTLAVLSLAVFLIFWSSTFCPQSTAQFRTQILHRTSGDDKILKLNSIIIIINEL